MPKVTETSAVMMLAVLRDGSADTGQAQKCGLCGRFKTEFVTSPGLRRKVPHRNLKDRAVVCTNADGPCIGAFAAKPILDALREACR